MNNPVSGYMSSVLTSGHQQLISNYGNDASMNLLATPLRTSSHPSRHYPSLSVPPHVQNRVSKTTSPRRRLNRRLTFTYDDVHRRSSLIEQSFQQQCQQQQQQQHLQQVRNIQLQQLQQQQRQQQQQQQKLVQYEYWNLQKQQLPSSANRRRQLGLMSGRPSSWHSASVNQLQSSMTNIQPMSTPNSAVSYASHASFLPYTSVLNSSGPISPSLASSPPDSYDFQNFKNQSNYLCSDPILATPCSSDSGLTMEKNWSMDIIPPNNYFGLQSPIDEDLLNCFQSVWSNPNPSAISQNLLTTPPTPNDIIPTESTQFNNLEEASQQKQALPMETSVDEELVGMGLYDDPESFQTPLAQPPLNSSLSLDQYHQTLMEKMMGINTQTTTCCELQGKGLKLEDTFTPILSDDDDDDDDDEDENDNENDNGDSKAMQDNDN